MVVTGAARRTPRTTAKHEEEQNNNKSSSSSSYAPPVVSKLQATFLLVSVLLYGAMNLLVVPLVANFPLRGAAPSRLELLGSFVGSRTSSLGKRTHTTLVLLLSDPVAVSRLLGS